MNKSILASLTAAALSALSPLAMAQNLPVESTQPSYLATRTHQDSTASIAQALRRVQAQQEQAARLGDRRAPALAVEAPSTQADFNAISERVAANRHLVGTRQNLAIDYLGERRDLYSVDHLNKILSQISAEQVSML